MAQALIKKIIFGSMIPLFLCTSCVQKKWNFHSINTTSHLHHKATNAFNGIEVEFLSGDFDTICYLNVLSRTISSQNVTIQIDDETFSYQGKVMEGKQRMRLPMEATNQLITSLDNAQQVSIFLAGFKTEL